MTAFEYLLRDLHSLYALVASLLGLALLAITKRSPGKPGKTTPKPRRSAAQTHRKPMRPLDYLWVAMDDDVNHLVVNTMMLFDKPLKREALETLVRERLFQHERFRMRVEQDDGLVFARYYWVNHDVDLKDHIFYHSCNVADKAALLPMVSLFSNAEMDRAVPLWQMHVFEGEDGQTCLLFRIHHAIGDGVALLKMLLGLTDPEDPAALKIKQVGRRPGGVSGAGSVTEHIVHFAKLIFGIVWASLSKLLLLRSASDTSLSPEKLGKNKKVAWTRPLPLDDVKRLAKEQGVTVNDVILSLVSSTANKMIELKDGAAPSEDVIVRAMIPMNLQPLDKRTELKNEVTMGIVDLHCGLDPAKRLGAIHKETSELKSGAEPLMYQLSISCLSGLSPLWAMRSAVEFMTTKFTLVLSNVPGPQTPLLFAGNRIKQILGMPPQMGTRLGLSFGVFSYNGTVTIGLYADASLTDDASEITAVLENEFDTVMAM